MARRRFTGRTDSVRRKTSWELGPQEIIPSVFTAPASAAWGAAAQVLSGGNTLVRIRGSVDSFITVGAANNSMMGAHGICMITEDANAAGAFPDPFTEDAWDGWIWHSFFTAFAPSADAVGWQHSHIDIDNKAMRKVSETDIMIGITEVIEPTAGLTLAVFANTRTLFMLP